MVGPHHPGDQPGCHVADGQRSSSIMFYEVVMRYVFEEPTLWVNEMSLWLAGMIYLFAGLYAMQQRSHIRIFILYDMVPRWLQRVFDVISTLFICCFAAAVV